ncbi:hypothetical protein [Jiangella endophytica]|nr:hypothetical protein [Jiangella endophytica]
MSINITDLYDEDHSELEDDSLWEPERPRVRMSFDQFLSRLDQVSTQLAR